MVCKEDICALYKKLPGATRIDVICALVQLSHPLERRFLGSVLENLCQIDYRCLLPEETRANNPDELRKITPDLHDACNRSRLSVYLSLLHSSNSVCSQLIFELLSSARTFVEKKNIQEGFSKVVVEEILLLLTLAANHPAFSFQQRKELFSFLQTLRKESKCSAEHSPGEIADNGLHLESCSESSFSPKSRESPFREGSNSPVLVKSLDLLRKAKDGTENVSKSSDKYTEFTIQVIWSNASENQVLKTYQDFFHFHSELIKLFPKDAGAHKQERHIPFLPQVKTHNEPCLSESSRQNLYEPMRRYVRQLGALPDRILQCQLFYQFFGNPSDPSSKQTTPPPPPSPPPSSQDVCDDRPNFTLWPGHSQHPVADSDSASVSSTEMVPTRIESMYYHNSTVDPAQYKQPTMLNAGLDTLPGPEQLNGPATAVSVLSSPPMQPPSSYVTPRPMFNPSVQSPVNGSPSHRPMHQNDVLQPDTFMSVSDWLHQARLHKYADKLEQYSFDELLNMTPEQLDELGLTAGAKNKFFQEIQNLRMYLKQCNGIQQPPPLPAECYIYRTIPAPLPPGMAPMPAQPPPLPPGGEGMLVPELGSATPVSSITSEEEVPVCVMGHEDMNGPSLLGEPPFPVLQTGPEIDLRPPLKVDKVTNPKGQLPPRRDQMGIDEGGVVPVVTVPAERRSPLVNTSYMTYMQTNLPRQPIATRFPPGMLYTPGMYPVSPRGQPPLSRPSTLDVGWSNPQSPQGMQGMMDMGGFDRHGNPVTTLTMANSGIYCPASVSTSVAVMSQGAGLPATPQTMNQQQQQQGGQTQTVITTGAPNGGGNSNSGINVGNGTGTQSQTPQGEGNMLMCKDCAPAQCTGNHTFQFITPNPAHMFPTQTYVPSPSNGLISPGFAISAPPPQGPGGLGHSFSHPSLGSNGINPALLPPNMQHLELYPGQGRPAIPQGTVMLHLPFIPQFSYYYSPSSASSNKRRMVTCYNCGQPGHMAKDCSSPPMDVHNVPATYHMDYKPKDVKSS